ncbi:MAG: hypothetical protein KAI70_01680 [Candidatus Omnitrophica bacterium]|nr:hypothetical protein [Candidatus Omnitrophota bacterium]
MSGYKIKKDRRPEGTNYSDWDTLSFGETLKKFTNFFDVLVPPIVVGLYGKWGSGKTEMINALAEEIDSSQYVTHVFDAWKFRKEKNIILPLLQEIASKHKKNTQVKNAAKNIITATTLITLNQVMKNKLGINIEEVKNGLKYAEEKQRHYEDFVNKTIEMEKDFDDLIDGIVKDEKKFIIFIDNLDRCLPEHTLDLLEDIANFMHSDKCIFILSMDKDVVIQAIQEKYKNFSGKNYLEKIIQIGLNMPTPAIDDSGKSKGIYHFMKRYEKAKGYDKSSEAGDSRDRIHKQLSKTLNMLFSQGFLNNPRRIERYVNRFIVLEKMNILNIEEKPDNVAFVIMMLVFKEQFPDAYNSVVSEKDIKTLNALINFSVTTDNTPSKFKGQPQHGLRIYNELLFELYKNDHSFYAFLGLFHKVTTDNGKMSDDAKVLTQFIEARKLVSMID